MDSPVPATIKRLGGITALSKKLGHENPSTVQGWNDRGVIPARQMPSVVAVAQAENIDLGLADFVPAAPSAPEQTEAA